MPKQLTQRQIIILGGAVLVVVVLGFIVSLNFRTKSTATQLNLTVWGTDPEKVFRDMFDPYTSGGSKSVLRYIQIDPSQYKEKILSALAAGTGPDIFEIGNRELPQWENVLAPLPVTATPQFNLISLEQQFPTVVEQDFVDGGQIYALPFSVDTLAMVYNKDIFDSAGIAFPPKTWDEFQADVPLLRTINSEGQITRSAAAIGGSGKTIDDAPDILFLLMMQNGAAMTSPDFTTATFASGGPNGTAPGLDAFNFYLQVANAASASYTWNDDMGNALDNFIQGKTAILFTYKSTLNEIKDKAPFLNVGVAAMPQATGASIFVNYAKYVGLAVPRAGQVASAWNFILQLTMSPVNENIYTSETGSPPALRESIAQNMSDPVLSIFASQALTARSWRESNDAKVNDIMNAAVVNVLNGSANSTKALAQAQEAVNEIQ